MQPDNLEVIAYWSLIMQKLIETDITASHMVQWIDFKGTEKFCSEHIILHSLKKRQKIKIDPYF